MFDSVGVHVPFVMVGIKEPVPLVGVGDGVGPMVVFTEIAVAEPSFAIAGFGPRRKRVHPLDDASPAGWE